jgi:signal transduction histidine kinase
LLVEAHVRPADLVNARSYWRASVHSISLAVIGLTLIVFAAQLGEVRQRARRLRGAITVTGVIVGTLILSRFLLLYAMTPLMSGALLAGFEVLINAGLILALVALGIDSIEGWRLSRRGRPLAADGARVALWIIVAFVAAGLANVALLWRYELFLQRVVSSTTLDPLNFSLRPFTADRLTLISGLVLMHVAVIWGAALIIRAAGVVWRTRRSQARRVGAVVAWTAGVAIGVIIASSLQAPAVPLLPLAAVLTAAALCSVMLAQPRRPLRKLSQAARLFGLYVALLVPALAAYPSVHAFAVQAKEDLVAMSFGPQAATLRDDLQQELEDALEDIDAVLPSLFDRSAENEAPTSNRAFHLWSQTALASSRLTSSVELYDVKGRAMSRFALNLTEYSTRLPRPAGCDKWDVFEDVSHILQASRTICESGRKVPIGTIVVRAMLDYRTLPFISSQSPYFESLRPEGDDSAAAPGRDVEFTMYGWSRAPLYVTGTDAWRLSNTVFRRAVETRTPFWETVRRGDDVLRAYFLNDRGGIYALSYPVLSTFGHLMNLAELIILAGVLYAVLLVLSGVVNSLTSYRLASGRALLREVRSSFYRKLFLAFVAVAVIPAFLLALAARNRLADQFRAGVNDTAVKTATVAQRLVEDYASDPRQRAVRALDVLDDSTMALVGRAIDQDVNLYQGPSLQATSERDLFESGFFPDRTPADVYRSIVIERAPTFVGIENVGGRYLLAAAPVRAGGAERIVTVPQTLRQRDLEAQIDELDRRVWSAFVLFVLLGASLGYWTAERIADPVSRLTRATRRIARGDFDARIAATSSDELRRLVEDFNRMAADLQGQRAERERTQRLEAWADMARQVAHDIKNPLTPIQLSAEHARRVNMDRGQPLSPVLDECVSAILTQVALLRQISAEFSSFASSPTPKPEPVDLAAVIEEVVEPYRVGLAGRITLEVTADRNVPQMALDRTLFARALTNVIENALHAMPGAGRLTVTSRLAAHGGRPSAIVTIADTGVGMDPEAMARIFEPYFSTRASGTGLGLTIAKRNVELNGGQITVESQRGSGTTVTISLPIT